MENSAYGSAHLPSPALVVFSQAAGGLGEALRIQRPFHSQLPDAKDLHHFALGSYGAHLLHGFPPHFLHPLNPAVSTAGGANGSPFGGGGAFVKPFPSNLPLPSAFAPPKCVGLTGLEQNMMFPSGGESFRTDSSSPACTSLSPPVKEESLEGHTSEDGDRDRICSPERSPETPGFRPPKTSNGVEPLNLRLDNGIHPLYRLPHAYSLSKRYFQQGIGGVAAKKTPSMGTPPLPNSCPVCGVQLSPNELETHFLTELDRLYKLSTPAERQRLRATFSLPGMVGSPGPDSRWETFHRIRNNRQNRLRAKTRKRKGDSDSDYSPTRGPILPGQCQSCPVCHGRLQRTPEEIAQHVEECLKKSGAQTAVQDEDETVDVEGYADDTSSSAGTIASHNNNNVAKMVDSSHQNTGSSSLSILSPLTPTQIPPQLPTSTPSLPSSQAEEGAISSLSSWDRKHRMTTANCTMTSVANQIVSRVTPTSSNQRVDLDYDADREQGHTVEMDNDEDVVVDNTDDEECIKRSRSDKRDDVKNSTEEATSSVEIDSVSDSKPPKAQLGTTPDSYVSTSESTEPSSRAQVLEELRARIRELEGSPFKTRTPQEEEHYKCYICKEPYKSPVISTICWHVHCDECWITISDAKKSCPQCKFITTTNDLRKIHV
ncbi:protein Teyrha-meyrha isoform X3 [Lutzomyia longipalpis]|uniref:protein Teyrha-meyrha isoform X3 n=1 Tax=Lutzomyia longipalpis TaxID=7200 RepID=UPI0024835089|nr:protein Teyrha-meyrha isoform X3 [Lutzomyia longipalpis]